MSDNLNIENEPSGEGLVEILENDGDPIWKDKSNELSFRELLLKKYRFLKDRLRGTYYAESPEGLTYDVGQDIQGTEPIFWNVSKLNFSKVL